MNVLKAVLCVLKFLFKSACNIFVDSDIRFLHIALNNIFKACRVIVKTERCLSFLTYDFEKLYNIFIIPITSIFLAVDFILADVHEIFGLHVSYLQLINTCEVKNCVLIINANNMLHT